MVNVITFGTFDLFHRGHLELFRKCKLLGHYLFVGVSTDEMNEKEKGKNAIINEDDRINIVKECKYVDSVFFEESLDKKKEYIEKLKADILVMGDDWAGEFDDMPCKVVYVPRYPYIDTTRIKNKIMKVQDAI